MKMILFHDLVQETDVIAMDIRGIMSPIYQKGRAAVDVEEKDGRRFDWKMV